MKIVANKDKKKRFPWRVILDNGRIIPVPSQHNFKTDFIKRHGCSLVAFYMALRYKGVKKYAADIAVRSKKTEMWCKVSADGNCEGNQHDLLGKAGCLS